MTDREAVRSSAKYLREVRPIDPEEVSDYVEGGAHPAVVRRILQEEAPDLGLVEREDGTFVPVPEEPVRPLPGAVEAVPERYVRRLEDVLVDRYGPDWHTGASGDLLRSTIRRVKSEYHRTQGRSVEYDDNVAAGYAIYHLPTYYAAVQYALSDLAERGLLGRKLRVLDVGAGVGGPALGLADLLPADALLEYRAVEPSPAAGILEALLEETGRNVHPTIDRERIEDVGLGDETYDLVLVANVLSELDDPEGAVAGLLEHVAEDGALLALAPADRNTSIQLREVERALEAGHGATVYGPTVRLWPNERPTDRGWSFDVRPDLAVPPFQRRLDEAGNGDGEFVNADVRYSYSILRRDGRRRIELELDASRWAKLADSERHVTNRVDLVAAKLSRSLSGDPFVTAPDEDDPNPIFKISDGSEDVDHYAVCPSVTTLNRALLETDYGDVCAFEGALMLWNDDEEGFNLVVDEETVVDRL